MFCIFAFIPSLSFSDSVDYSYDDNGRLVKTINADNTRVLYQYDEVGNLIAVFKETSAPQALPPALQNINPSILLIGETYSIVITGENLLTTSSITSDNPGLTIKSLAAIDTKIIAVFSISDTAATGPANITVTTSYGSASMSVNICSVIIEPRERISYPLKTETLSVSLTPSVPGDLSVSINNMNPDILNTPPVITIPAGGSAGLSVQTLSPGMGIIRIGNAESAIYVIGGNEDVITSAAVSVYVQTSSDIPAIAEANPVSVGFEIPAGNSSTASSPVSVYVQTSSDIPAIAEANPVSVGFEIPSVYSSIASSPVSVYVQTSSDIPAIAEANPVSVGFEIPSVYSSIASSPVSVYVQTSSDVSAIAEANPISVGVEIPAGNSSTASLPVSVYVQTSSVVSAIAEANPVSVGVETPAGNSSTASLPVSVGRCSELPVKVTGAATGYYAALQDAYNAASSGDIIRSHAGLLSGSLLLDQGKTVSMEGGYDCGFTTVIGTTSINGAMTFRSSGTFKINNFILKK